MNTKTAQNNNGKILITLNEYVSGSGLSIFPVREKAGEKYFNKKSNKWITPKEKTPYIRGGIQNTSKESK